jgi:uncharacterized protein (TIGR00730 family)
MKKITFIGSGIELEHYNSDTPEIDSIVEVVSKYYDTLLFGGTTIGLMGAFASSAKKNNMKITCIIPEWFFNKNKAYVFKGDEIILTRDLSERKNRLENTNCLICYPGGVGTLDELFNLIAKISLGEAKNIPILLYNFERFFSPVLLQIQYGIKTGLIKKEVMDFLYTFENVDKLKDILEKIKK